MVIAAPLSRGAFREEARLGIRMPQILMKECASGGGRLRRRGGANTCTLARTGARTHRHPQVRAHVLMHIHTHIDAHAVFRCSRSLTVP